MLKNIINWPLGNPGILILALMLLIGYGFNSYQRMPVDAFPDISPVMVPIFAESHGMAPEEMERLITFPVESAMNGLPGVRLIKSTSAFGMSVIYVYSEDDTDIYFARQLVAERLASVSASIPRLDEPPALGPISTGLGQIMIYYLAADEKVVDTEGKDISTWLREINDWIVKYQLMAVKGVTDVLSMGGHVLQYEVNVNPNSLMAQDIGLEDVVEAINGNNRNAGGQFLIIGSEEHLLRGIGLVGSLEELQKIPVKSGKGRVVTLADVADVRYGHEIRRGVVTRNGESEVVSGMVLKLYGENTSEVIDRLKTALQTVRNSLPEGVEISQYYDQAELVGQATNTVKSALLQGGLLVFAVLALFMGNWRAAAIVALALPVSVLIAVILMEIKGISANLMTLGGVAVAIGMLGDGTIVVVENILRRLQDNDLDSRKQQNVLEATLEVARPVLFSAIIIILVFVPIFTLENVEGKMFSPMAFTISGALSGALIFALIIAPGLAILFLKSSRKKKGSEEVKKAGIVEWLQKIYRPLLVWACSHRFIVLTLIALMIVITPIGLSVVGTEFMPVLEEGSILVGVSMAPSISLEKATGMIMSMEQKLLKFDEVEEIISRIGRPEAGSHPHPVNTAEIHLELKPMEEWKDYHSKAKLIVALREALESVPGAAFNFTQPIQNAFDELLAGVKTQLAIKIFGEDLNVLKKIAETVSEAVEDVPGIVDLMVEQNFGQPQVQVIVDREAASIQGVSVDHILEMVELAFGGETVDHVYLNTRRFGIAVRFQEDFRDDVETIESALIHTEDGRLIPLGQVADVRHVTGPIQINRERNSRRWIVGANVSGRDIGSVVEEIQERIRTRVDLPPGYVVEYGGQFENQQRAMKRLAIIVPLVFIGVFASLWMSMNSLKEAAMIIVNVPLAMTGGVIGLLVAGEYLSVPASVGFIALFGIAVQNSMVLVTCFDSLRRQGYSDFQAVIEGTTLRLRPVLMTAMTTVLGLLPLLISRGPGSEVQRPLAAVVVFGLTTSTLLTLFVLPVIYSWAGKGKELEEQSGQYKEHKLQDKD